MKHAKVQIVDKWERNGDRNPAIKVYGIKTKSGHVFETCGNYGNHTEYPDPIQNVKDAIVGNHYVIAYGNAVSYSTPTLIGIEV